MTDNELSLLEVCVCSRAYAWVCVDAARRMALNVFPQLLSTFIFRDKASFETKAETHRFN